MKSLKDFADTTACKLDRYPMQATLAAFCWGGQDELRSPDNVILIQGLRKQKSFQRIFSQHFQQYFVQIIMPVIKAEFGFFQVQVKRMSCYAVKLYQTVFCITPKRLDTVDILRSAGKFILPVTHPEMLCKTHINQAVITTPAISIDDTLNRNVPAYYLLQCGFGRIRNDFRIDLAAPFEHAGNDGFATGTAPAFTTMRFAPK